VQDYEPPSGDLKQLIDSRWKSLDNFISTFNATAAGVQVGSRRPSVLECLQLRLFTALSPTEVFNLLPFPLFWHQGSGWGWLAYNKATGGLEIVTTQNQDPCSTTVGELPRDLGTAFPHFFCSLTRDGKKLLVHTGYYPPSRS